MTTGTRCPALEQIDSEDEYLLTGFELMKLASGHDICQTISAVIAAQSLRKTPKSASSTPIPKRWKHRVLRGWNQLLEGGWSYRESEHMVSEETTPSVR